MKSRLPPAAVMTKFQKEAAEKYAMQMLENGLKDILPQLENLVIIAAADSGLKERTTQRIINHYEQLFTEFADDLLADAELAKERIQRAMQQREIVMTEEREET